MLKEFANQNVIVVGGFSNPASLKQYNLQWPNEPKNFQKYMQGHQCGGCTYFAKFNSDYGLCCSPHSRHRLETVFEHFSCADQQEEGWYAHSFGDIQPRPDNETQHGKRVKSA